MRYEAWGAMNNIIARHRPETHHQIVSDEIVESLHEAGYIIVPHKITNKMLVDGGTMEGSDDNSHRDWYGTVISGCIENRQQSES